MKKAKLLVYILICTFVFSSCGKNKEINVSDQHLQYGQRAVEIADQYLDYEITASKALDMLEVLSERENELPEYDSSDKNRANNSEVKTYTFLIKSAISRSERMPNDNEYLKIVEYRNEIADAIGIDAR